MGFMGSDCNMHIQ